jgi:hypothetical protein
MEVTLGSDWCDRHQVSYHLERNSPRQPWSVAGVRHPPVSDLCGERRKEKFALHDKPRRP